MNCLSDELIRGLVDHEVDESERKEAERHLGGCAKCRARMERIAHESEAVGRALAALAPAEVREARQPLERFQMRIAEQEALPPERPNLLVRWFSAHPIPAWGVAAVTALIIVLITLAPARSWAQRVLAMLRVENVTVVPVDLNFTPNSDTQALVRQLISNDVTVTLSAGKPQLLSDVSQASQIAGFPVRTITSLGNAPKIGVTGEQAYVMTLDQARLQSILNSFGRTDLHVPAAANGQTVAVHIAKSAFLRWGNCAEHHAGPGAVPQQSAPSSGGSCVMLAEVPSPIVSIPPDLNVSQLFQVALEAAGMTPQEAQAFCATVDWKSTLVIPIPRRVSSYVEEQVDGVEGDLVMGPSYHGRPPEFDLIWVKNGIVYSLHGYGGPDQALALASSLS
ncbi:MAG: anti-sigma factor family protein [Terriglobia bacterium]